MKRQQCVASSSHVLASEARSTLHGGSHNASSDRNRMRTTRIPHTASYRAHWTHEGIQPHVSHTKAQGKGGRSMSRVVNLHARLQSERLHLCRNTVNIPTNFFMVAKWLPLSTGTLLSLMAGNRNDILDHGCDLRSHYLPDDCEL
jgi:hypothetical protein